MLRWLQPTTTYITSHDFCFDVKYLLSMWILLLMIDQIFVMRFKSGKLGSNTIVFPAWVLVMRINFDTILNPEAFNKLILKTATNFWMKALFLGFILLFVTPKKVYFHPWRCSCTSCKDNWGISGLIRTQIIEKNDDMSAQ